MGASQDAAAIFGGLNQGINRGFDAYNGSLDRALRQKALDFQQQEYKDQHAPVAMGDIIATTADPSLKAHLQSLAQGNSGTPRATPQYPINASPSSLQDVSQTPGAGGLMQAIDQGSRGPDSISGGMAEPSTGISEMSPQRRALYAGADTAATAREQAKAKLAEEENYHSGIVSAKERDSDTKALNARLLNGLSPTPWVNPRIAKMQDASLQKIVPILESARGNPEVSQALKDRYAAAKVDSLMKQAGDPNNLSPQMTNLVISEVGKIASGGVPTQHEFDALTPGTLKGALASAWSKLSNNPTSANAGAFLKEYQNYSKDLSENANQVINNKLRRVIEVNKKQLGSENYATLKDNYLGEISPSKESKQEAASPQLSASQKRIISVAPKPQGKSDSDILASARSESQGASKQKIDGINAQLQAWGVKGSL